MDRLDFFRTVPLFADLPDRQLADLAGAFRPSHFAAGAVIFYEGDPGRVMYLIERGQVRISILGESGRETAVVLCGPGDLFGELAVIDGLPRSASATALAETLVHTLDADSFRHYLQRDPQFALNFLTTLSDRVRYNTQQVGSLAELDVAGRLARKLIELGRDYGVAAPNGVRIAASLTQSDLASLVASSRESVNKVLGQFRQQGLIARQSGQIVIRDLDGLRAYARGVTAVD